MKEDYEISNILFYLFFLPDDFVKTDDFTYTMTAEGIHAFIQRLPFFQDYYKESEMSLEETIEEVKEGLGKIVIIMLEDEIERIIVYMDTDDVFREYIFKFE